MPNPKSAEQEWREEEGKLTSSRDTLMAEIAGLVEEQTLVYRQYLRPYSDRALVLTSAPRGRPINATRVLSPEQVEGFKTAENPTLRFEYGRSEVERIGRLLTPKRNALAKTEARLQEVRAHLRERSHATDDPRGGFRLHGGGSESEQPLGEVPAQPQRADGPGVPGQLGEWLDTLRARTQRALASHAGDGGGVRS